MAEIGELKITMTKKFVMFLPVAAFCLFTATLLHADTRKSVKTVPPVYPAIALPARMDL